MGKVKLVVDTDGVADDVRAITIAVNHPDVEVLAITTVHGCVSVEQATANVARCLRASGVSKPIYKGAMEPIVGRKSNILSENVLFGKDGLGDRPKEFPEVLKSDFVPTSDEIAATALIRISREHPDATLVCLGPLTNVALALKLDPNFKFAKVFVMGGNYYGIGNVVDMPTVEFNFHGDPDAASVVLRKLADRLTIIPWDLIFLEGSEHEKQVDMDAHLKHDTKVASFVKTATRAPREALGKVGRKYTYCDEIAMCSAIDLKRVARKINYFRVDVELTGSYTRGQVVVDWLDVLWTKDEAGFVAAQGKDQVGKLPFVKFVASCNATVVDTWMNNAVLQKPGPW
ncbi:unnamed protein product [Cylicocyclus nassatus]|uniref:Inosine/uridine-preferring nucleoside hydrolase domain-containing protein n=1 Tax=Cylicocyclus nassatus TaxID=53992 RepID=A0AA36HBL7_CYLNA|nr:unnamed protein product [Cylicocyclus nassatus]